MNKKEQIITLVVLGFLIIGMLLYMLIYPAVTKPSSTIGERHLRYEKKIKEKQYYKTNEGKLVTAAYYNAKFNPIARYQLSHQGTYFISYKTANLTKKQYKNTYKQEVKNIKKMADEEDPDCDPKFNHYGYKRWNYFYTQDLSIIYKSHGIKIKADSE